VAVRRHARFDHKNVVRLTALVWICVVLPASTTLAATPAPDTILFNGKIFTAEGQQFVQALALTAAYAEFAEKEKGSLAPGKLADLAVLSQDIFTVPSDDLPRTVSVMTMVGGKMIYDAHLLSYVGESHADIQSQ
jgi:predicted amidohydrolase YtcJ